jgi:hypothetical protein
MKTRRSTPTDGVATRLGDRNAGNGSPTGSGTGDANGGISFNLPPFARPSVLLLSQPLHHTPLLPPVLLPPQWVQHGTLAASLARILCSRPRERFAARQIRHASHRSNAEKLMGADVWSLAPVFAMVGLVRNVGSVKGMAVLRQSRAG